MNILTILVTLLILSVLVVVHELGHFLTAKKTGVFVEEFAIGMGPKVYGKQGKETLFTIRAFPIGGFCKMRGEEPETDEEGNHIKKNPVQDGDPRSFESKSQPEKLLILAAGSLMNIFFAFLCLVGVGFLLGGTNILKILSFAGINTFNFGGIILDSFRMLVTGEVGLENVAGPIGMVSMVDTLMRQGVTILLTFTAMLSVNLGIINLLPLPALDGGRILVILIELITKRKFSQEIEMKINFFGFVALMALALVVAVNDIVRIAF
ncbi:MAG: M50 family metallopeptidase [Eubacteriaceae bacterium]